LNSKKYLLNEAERLFTYEFLTVDEIANRLNLSRRTICNWKERGDWNNRRKEYLKSKQSFHQELYEFARKLMNGISTDLDNGEKVDPGRMYAFCRILPMFAKVKDYEDVMTKKEEKQANKGLTPELIAQIEEQVLGISPDDTTNDQEE